MSNLAGGFMFSMRDLMAGDKIELMVGGYKVSIWYDDGVKCLRGVWLINLDFTRGNCDVEGHVVNRAIPKAEIMVDGEIVQDLDDGRAVVVQGPRVGRVLDDLPSDEKYRRSLPLWHFSREEIEEIGGAWKGAMFTRCLEVAGEALMATTATAAAEPLEELQEHVRKEATAYWETTEIEQPADQREAILARVKADGFFQVERDDVRDLWPGGNIVEWAADNGLSCRMGPYGDARLEVGK